MQKGRSLSTLLFLLSIYAGMGQELTWQWASFATSRGYNRSFNSASCGFHNTLYAVCNYDSLIFAGDTVINHPEINSGSSVNSIVVTYTSTGEFVDLVDLHTIPGSTIFDTYAGAAEDENLNITCTFSKRMFLQDTMINHCNTPFIDHPDIMIAQLDKYRNINWVRTIGGTFSDQVHGMVVTGSGDTYLVSDHTATASPPTIIDFFQQDSVIITEDLTSISKLNQDGILEWRIELLGNFSSTHLSPGKNALLYFWASAHSDVIINNDTMIISEDPDLWLPFICCFDHNGTIVKAEFADFPVSPYELVVNGNGDFFISSYVYDTLVIGYDTTIIPPDLSYRFMGKFNSKYQPEWYYVVPNQANQQLGSFYLEADGDDLAFCSYANHDIQLGDTVIDLPGNKVVFAGIFDSNGNLKDFTISHVTGEFLSTELLIDKCGNMIVSGSLKGKIYLENDTVNSYLPGRTDAALMKIRRNEPTPIWLGPDTNACDEYFLVGPPGYQQYTLNDSLLEQNSTLITETGTYVFGCSNDGCWVFDTIFIGIHPGISLYLGNDTTIFANDTIVLSVPEIYDSVRWFDGSSTFEKMVIAKDYPLGLNYIWAEVFSGPCSASDTLILEIKSDFGVEEIDGPGILAYPNPFRDDLTVEASSAIKEINVIDYQGNVRYTREFDHGSKRIRVELEGLESGIYMLKVITREGTVMVTKMLRF